MPARRRLGEIALDQSNDVACRLLRRQRHRQACLCIAVSEPSSASNTLKSLAFMIISRQANHAEIMRLH